MATQHIPSSDTQISPRVHSVPWWSEPITIGIPSPISAFTLGVVGFYRGWNRKVRVSLILDGQTQAPVTFLMLNSTLQVRLNELSPSIPFSSFSPCVLLEFQFDQGPEDTLGRPCVVFHTKMPLLEVPSSVTYRAPRWRLIVHYLRHGPQEPRGNELEITIRKS